MIRYTVSAMQIFSNRCTAFLLAQPLAHAVLQRPEIHELPVLGPQEADVLNLHTPAYGASPWNSPRCVPEHRKRPAMVSSFATSATISSRHSEKALRNSANKRFTLRAALGANNSSTATGSPPELMVSTRRRTIDLIRSGMPGPPLGVAATLSRSDTRSNGRCSIVERLLIIVGLFVAAGLCEIGGGYLVWDGCATISP